ncbi:P2X purinoceptor 7, partial [Latimeria chalumnae]|uniref:P2X purinoceptor 7 n=1 Tax=Latimeria chalumnae TaxID=7897 RepID=UPI00313E6A87
LGCSRLHFSSTGEKYLFCYDKYDHNKKSTTKALSRGVQTGRCVNYDAFNKSCEVFAWCPVEAIRAAPVPALLRGAEKFSVLIKNNIRFPEFNYTKRNILPHVNETYLKTCTFNRTRDPHCPVFILGNIFQEAGENFSEVAIQGGVMGIQINWDCNLDNWNHKCVPEYTFRRLDNKNANETLSPGYNFRFAQFYKFPNGTEERTLIKAYGIRFDVMVFGTAGRFSFVALILYIGSTLSYYGLTALLIDLLITTYFCPSCPSKEIKDYYLKKIYKSVDRPTSTLLYVSFVDEQNIFVVKGPLKVRLQDAKSDIVLEHKVKLQEHIALLQPNIEMVCVRRTCQSSSEHIIPPWCQCGNCHESSGFQEMLCCRKNSGPCITTSTMFSQFALSQTTLEFILLYNDPLLDLHANRDKDMLRHCAYQQYIHWRFGGLEKENCAVIPSCCIWKIRETYPSLDGQYTGFRGC